MTRDLAVHAEGLVRTFGDVRALDGIDLTVERGQVVGLLGPNGAGKTTTVRILSTLLAPTAGRATVAGFDVVKQADEVRRSIGLTGQYAAVDEYLTGRENLRMFGGLYHLTPAYVKERSEELLDWFDLSEAADRPAKTYSGGMRRRLDLAASAGDAMHNPADGRPADPKQRADLAQRLPQGLEPEHDLQHFIIRPAHAATSPLV
jgi:ABC-type multidrug transport system ATPase subunit